MPDLPEPLLQEETSNPLPLPLPLPQFCITTMPEIPENPIKELPEETIKDIIVLLPVKSLLKFRSVRHSWLSFIDSPYCIKTHVSKSTPRILINTPRGLFALNFTTQNHKLKAGASALKLWSPCPDTFILGSCNGLLLSHHNGSISPLFLSTKNRCNVAFQNPYTRTFETIPYVAPEWPGPKDCYSVPEKFVFSFWYDDLADDYKFFRICQFYGGFGMLSEVTVYSLKMGSFKKVAPFPYYMKYANSQNVFVGGALHWVVSTSEFAKPQWICSFDVTTEEYRLVEQPVYSSGDYKLFLHDLGGCLTAICSDSPSERKEVWVMKKYGDVDSWCNILTLDGADVGVESFGYLKPLIYSECGKKVLIERDCKTLFWYDLEKKCAEFVELDLNHGGQFQAFVHLESLVKLSCRVAEKSGARDIDEKPDKKTKKRDDFLSTGFKLKF